VGGDGVVFFLQAEDGIRDWSVTGVQTCALPISDQGDSGLAILGQYPGSQLPPALVVWPFPGGQDAYINQADFPQIFAADVPAAQIGRASCRERGEGPVGRDDVQEESWRCRSVGR